MSWNVLNVLECLVLFLRLECLSCDRTTFTNSTDNAAMTKLRYCISSKHCMVWFRFASCLEQHELYLRLAGKDSEWIFCSDEGQICQCNTHVRLLACLILYVDLQFSWAPGRLLKRYSSPPAFQKYSNAKVGNDEEMDVDQPR